MGGKRKRTAGSVAAQAGGGKAGAQTYHGKKKLKTSGAKKASGSALQQPQEKRATAAKPAALANSNWLALKSKIQQQDQRHKGGQAGEKKRDLDVKAQKLRAKQEKQSRRQQQRTAEWVDNARIVAMDCEMVGVGLSGKTSVLARCSIVDYDGNVLYDKPVRPVEKVTDFRTHVSGIKSSTLRHAIPFAQCLKEVGKLLQDKIIVGHALKNDFQALMFTPPKHLIRDTAYYRPYMRRKMNGTVRKLRIFFYFVGRLMLRRVCFLQKLYPKALKHLTEEVLGRQIQTGQHDSVRLSTRHRAQLTLSNCFAVFQVEDARATLELYKREQYAWEKYLRTNKGNSSLVGVAPALPEKNPEDSVQEVPAAAKAHLDSDDEDFGTGRGVMAVPDSKALAIMEYGE
ncbi:unnamed protein product [Phytophthora fragariaefolia]|uniref:RNA exonuclease 4 n=1 Tax=Phytophthora fragariaefolia TaxID=1490495 RepID=A0A9W7CUI7_9STRA|nr:unnamed protein product [Phytophthora fragariaefolia]